MPNEPESLALAADFPTPSRDDWRALVSAVLAKSGAGDGVDPEDALSYTTYDGITIKPLYTADDAHGVSADGRPGHAPFVRGATEDGGAATGWDVRTRHADPDPARTNAAVLADLERGATSLWLVVGDGGLAVDDLDAALQGVYLDLAPIVLDAGAHTERAAQALLTLSEQRGVDPAELSGNLGADPIGTRARTGAEADLGLLPTLSAQSTRAPKLRVATVDATVFHDAGASDAQELGLSLAVGVAYLRALVDAGLPVDDALDSLDFRYAVTAEQFPSIAKLRAARRVWDRVAELSGASDDRRGQRQHAVTSAAMMTRRDPWANLLRTTIGCFAGAIGGAEAITVLPFDSAIGRSDDFARRIARNTHAVLHDESSLARVVDAAGGSWFVESLTDQLAVAAWDVFTSIEKSGGALAALDDGTVAALIAATNDKRLDDIAHRRSPITGVTEFAFVDELPVEREPLPPIPEGMLPPLRYAQDFEALRDRADAAPERPKVFLAGLGPLAAHSARTGFAANLFQAGGLDCVTGSGELDELLAAFEKSGTTVACLCSSDSVYADAAAPAAKALRDAGATTIWLAGKAEVEGVDGTLYAGCDALAVLRSVFETLGVK
ncbi:MAG TPA: methylmalonyl-CoA mutase family protein [Jatrophihabitans sp.]|jgi:methylmalonyl-CoA mutase|uniref:methylmalonyl-CoA mutase family protein n=1 Tax=Jatrophihabitans sp. TaxID=1932789 RepID=UPI002DF86D42|nr:methylmalonyl-CoA mutase family protein [Jatrophihabitans sp.]